MCWRDVYNLRCHISIVFLVKREYKCLLCCIPTKKYISLCFWVKLLLKKERKESISKSAILLMLFKLYLCNYVLSTSLLHGNMPYILKLHKYYHESLLEDCKLPFMIWCWKIFWVKYETNDKCLQRTDCIEIFVRNIN